MKNKIGLKIRNIREAQGITQEQMGFRLNVSQSNYGRLEKDDNRISVPKLFVIANILKVNPVDLLTHNNTVAHEQTIS